MVINERKKVTFKEDVSCFVEEMGKQSMPMKKLHGSSKRPLAAAQKSKRVFSDVPGESTSHKRRRATTDRSYCHVEVDSPAMERAKEIQAGLAAEFPSFVKYMLPSHVTGGFWLGLPKKFCATHLPRQDTEVLLEDENGEQHKTKYLAEKVGLSAGWRGFSIAHELLEGDVLVFHLVRPHKFKVYIVRSNSLDEVDGALGLLNLETSSKQVDFGKNIMVSKEVEGSLETLLIDIHHGNIQENTQMLEDTNFECIADQPEDNSEDLGSEISEGIRFSDSVVEFKEVKSIENFTVLVNGLVIDSELSKYIRAKYYDICCSQNSFLHENLVEGINCKLAAGIVMETVNIADAIRASKPTTSQADLATWDKTLRAFEDLGMNVGFLRARLERLIGHASESKNYRQASLEQVVHADKEMRTLQEKLLEVREAAKRLDAEVETLMGNVEKHEHMFQEVASAPW